jgi:O-acetylserine/cysteine efflux transporter
MIAKAELTVLPRNRNWNFRPVGLTMVGMRPAHVSLAVLVAAIWGLNFVIVDVGLDDFPPLLLSALRFTLASLPLLVMRGGPGVPWRWLVAVSVAIGIVKFSLLFVGMDVGMPAGLASLVLQVQAFFTIGFAAALLRERVRLVQAGGLLLATAGLALVASGLDGVATPAGFALVVAAAAAWGIGNVAIKRAAPADAFRFMTWWCVIPPLPLFALSLAFEGPGQVGDALASIDLGGIAAVAYIAFAATTVGWGLWAYLMRRYPSSTVAPFSLLVPVFGLGFAALLRDEPLGVRTVVAGALVVSGVLLTQRAPRISPQIATIRAAQGLHGEASAG